MQWGKKYQHVGRNRRSDQHYHVPGYVFCLIAIFVKYIVLSTEYNVTHEGNAEHVATCKRSFSGCNSVVSHLRTWKNMDASPEAW